MAAVMNSSMNSTSPASALGIPEGARRASEGMPRARGGPRPGGCRDRQAPPVLGRREARVARRGRPLQASRHPRRVPAQQAHLFLDALELAQANGCVRSRGAEPKETGAEAGSFGPADRAAQSRERPSAPQARARGADHRCPKKTMCATGAADLRRPEPGGAMSAVAALMPHIGLSKACRAFALNRGFVYRNRSRHRPTVSRHARRVRARPPLAFSIAEQDLLLGLLGSARFVDMAPAALFATLLDEGQHYGSIHPVYTKPELLAIAPNEVWSWDITKIRGPVKWSYSHLYVILDIFSRYVVG